MSRALRSGIALADARATGLISLDLFSSPTVREGWHFDGAVGLRSAHSHQTKVFCPTPDSAVVV